MQFETSKLWQKILLLALPVAVQSLLQALLGMADVAMVGTLGPTAVAAVGLAAKLHFLLLVLMFGVASASGVLIAQYCGAKDQIGCRRTLTITLLVGLGLMTPFTLLFFLGYQWLPLISPDPEVIQLAGRYLLITAPTLLMVQLILVYESGLRSLGETLSPLIIGAVGVVLNVLFNYVLIFGYWGFPTLGVEGAAWGTLFARILQLGIYGIVLYRRDHLFRPSISSFRLVRNVTEIQRFVKFALPLVVNHGVWGLGNATYHIATGFAGTQALAVMGVMVPIEGTIFSLFIGLASASAVLIGQALGRDDHEEAWHYHKLFDRLTIYLALALCSILWLTRFPIARQMIADDPQTAQLLADTLVIFCCVAWVKVLNMVRILGVLRAGGDNTFCLITDTIVMWGFGVPIFLIAVWLKLPFCVLYSLMALEDILKCIPMIRRIRLKIWMKNLTRVPVVVRD